LSRLGRLDPDIAAVLIDANGEIAFLVNDGFLSSGLTFGFGK
jgi:hypothetical protein